MILTIDPNFVGHPSIKYCPPALYETHGFTWKFPMLQSVSRYTPLTQGWIVGFDTFLQLQLSYCQYVSVKSCILSEYIYIYVFLYMQYICIYVLIRLYIYVDMIIYYVYAYGISSHQPLYQCVFVLIFFCFSALRRNCVLFLGNNVQVPSKANGWLGQAPLFSNSNSDWKKTIPNGNVIFQTLLFRFELLVCRECNICLIGGFKHFLFSLLLGEII